MSAAEPKRLGRPPNPGGERRETPVCTVRLPKELHAVLRGLHKAGRLVPYLRRAQKALDAE